MSLVMVWRSRYHTVAYFLRPYRGACLLIIILSLVGGALEAAGLGLLLPLLQGLLGTGVGTDASLQFGERFNAFIAAHAAGVDPLVFSCLVLLVLHLMRQAVATSTDFAIASTSSRVMHDVRKRIYHTYAAARYAFFLDHKVGEVTYNSAVLPSKAFAMALNTIPRLVVELCRVGAIVLLMVWLNPLLTLLLAGIFGLLYLPMAHLTGRRLYRNGVETRVLNTELTVQLTEFFSGIKQIAVGNATPIWLSKIDAVNRALRRAYVRQAFLPAIPSHVFETVSVVGLLGLIIVLRIASPAQLHNSLLILGLFGVALLRAMPSLVMIGQHVLAFANFLPDLERLYDLLHEEVPRATSGGRPVSPLQQGIAFERVTFGYPGQPPLFHDVSLEFPKGAFVVIMGLSGGGKTTLMNLILGLYTPTAGRVVVDGIDVRELELSSWHERIGFVSQDMVLFHASVFENIRLFNPRSAEAEVERAARATLAHDFIGQLPQGYHTIIGERGMRLSGGQQQRLALARAILHEPEILLLDEATSALDRASEQLVQQAIQAASAGRTVVAIAHRLSRIRQADRIYVIDHGKVAGAGRHDELLRGNAQYRVLQGAAVVR